MPKEGRREQTAMDTNEQDMKGKIALAKETANQKIQAGTARVEDVSKKTESKVGAGVAAVKGVLTGLTDQMEKEDLGGTAKGAIERTGNVAREVGQAGAQETKKVKDEVKRDGTT